jgi:hypothetical protein
VFALRRTGKHRFVMQRIRSSYDHEVHLRMFDDLPPILRRQLRTVLLRGLRKQFLAPRTERDDRSLAALANLRSIGCPDIAGGAQHANFEERISHGPMPLATMTREVDPRM